MKRVNLFQVQRGLAASGPDIFIQLQRQWGDHLYADVPFIGRTHYCFHPDHAHAALVSQAEQVIKPGFALRVLKSSFGEGLFTSGGVLWKRQRKLMQPAFHHAKISRYAERIVGHTQAMLDPWKDGDSVEIDAAMHGLTLTIVVDALFSTDVRGQTAQVGAAMKDLGAAVAAQSESLLLAFMPDWVPLPALRRKRRGVASIDSILYAMIRERRQLGEEASPHDLLTALVFAQDVETSEQMSDQQVRDELMTLFIAGHETTAVLLGWAWAMLAQQPEVEARLHAELDRELVDGVSVVEALPRLVYTQHIIKETLRLYPPAWFVLRQATQPLDLNGAPIQSGEIVFIMPYVLQRDPRWYDQPDAFRPERWEGNVEKQLPKGAYIPFGSGPRVCIGNGFALMEAQLILATMAQRYRVELCSPARITQRVGTLAFAAPVQVRLHARR